MNTISQLTKEHLEQLYRGYCEMPILWERELLGLNQFEKTILLQEKNEFPIIKSNKRLGKLAEDLFSIWLRGNSQYDIIFENLQIIQGKITLGELDVILFDTFNNEYVHLELVTKFYLYDPNFEPNDIKAWIGPNRNDSLYNKISKLKQKQLPLLYNEFTKEILQKYIPKKINVLQKVCFKAYLFVPLNFENKALKRFNLNCIAGNYLTFIQFQKIHIATNQYFCPSKQDWLRKPKTQQKWNSFLEIKTIIQQFMKSNQSLMIWIKNVDKYNRFIIVPYDVNINKNYS